MNSHHSGPSRIQALGLTLIELMVVVAIMSTLAMVAARFGVQWSNSSKVTQAQAMLQQAYALAKATALQNYRGQVNGGAAAVLCFSNTQLNVYQGPTCSGKAVWTRPWDSGVAITFGTPATAASCIGLTSAAVPVASAGALTCATNLNYSLTAGTVNVSKSLY